MLKQSSKWKNSSFFLLFFLRWISASILSPSQRKFFGSVKLVNTQYSQGIAMSQNKTKMHIHKFFVRAGHLSASPFTWVHLPKRQRSWFMFHGKIKLTAPFSQTRRNPQPFPSNALTSTCPPPLPLLLPLSKSRFITQLQVLLASQLYPKCCLSSLRRRTAVNFGIGPQPVVFLRGKNSWDTNFSGHDMDLTRNKIFIDSVSANGIFLFRFQPRPDMAIRIWISRRELDKTFQDLTRSPGNDGRYQIPIRKWPIPDQNLSEKAGTD